MFSNHSESWPPIFLLAGFPGLEKHHFWISLPICSMYLVALTGNCTILFVIRTDPTLHSPMYYFLSMLALSDLGLSFTALPTMLSVLWFNHHQIHFDACLIQMFFIHTFSILESGILLSMAFDHLVAIWNPLRYIRDSHQDWGGIVLQSSCLVLPGPILMSLQEFGRMNVLSYSMCLHPDLLKLVHSDRRNSSIYGLIVMLSSTGVDSLLLVLSYVLILRTILGVASKEERSRVLSTCISHLCAVLSFSIPMLGLSMITDLGGTRPPSFTSSSPMLLCSCPPLMNLIVHSVKTKQILRGSSRSFRRREYHENLDSVGL